MFIIPREPSIALGLTAQAKDKENEAPCGNITTNAIKACSPKVDKTSEAPCGQNSEDAIKAGSSPVIKSNTSHEYAGNTWEKYFMATVEEPVNWRESPSGAGQSIRHDGKHEGQPQGKPLEHEGQPQGEPLGGDKYSAIALLDDDQEEEKWTERTAVITALDHQVRKIMKPNLTVILIFL